MQLSGYTASKFARRVGYGLKFGETIPDDAVEWASEQLISIPKLGVIQPDGSDLLHDANFQKNKDHLPIPEMSEAVKLWGQLHNRWLEINELANTMSPSEWQSLMYKEVYFRRADIVQWRDCLCRASTAAHGEASVFEKFWTFWVNHFAVHARHFTKLFYGPHTRIIREHMLGHFNDLARNAILNPAMLEYLDNLYSTGPNSFMVKEKWDRGATINENLGREVLELHTIGTAAGFNQDDVTQMAYALTGWGVYSGKKDEHEGLAIRGQDFGAYFEPRRHEPGSRNIFDLNIPFNDKGMDQAPLAIDMLAHRPETIERLSIKLAKYFISDDPPVDAVQNIITTWNETNGFLPAIHRTVVEQCYEHIDSTKKLSTSEEWLFQLYRTTGAQIPTAAPGSPQIVINQLCSELGQPYDEVPQPDGWPTSREYWLSSALLERKIRFAKVFADKSNLEKEAFIAIIRRDYDGKSKELNEIDALIDGIKTLNFDLEETRRLALLYSCSPNFLYA